MTTAPRSRQEAYDRQREYFNRPDAVLARKGAPGSADFACQYRVDRVPENPGCAVGCILPDELYDPKFDACPDGNSFESVVNEYPEFEDYFFGDLPQDEELFKLSEYYSVTQGFHDTSSTVTNFLFKLDQYAREIGLTVPEKK